MWGRNLVLTNGRLATLGKGLTTTTHALDTHCGLYILLSFTRLDLIYKEVLASFITTPYTHLTSP